MRLNSLGVLLLGYAFKIPRIKGGMPADLLNILLTSVVLIYSRDSTNNYSGSFAKVGLTDTIIF